MATLVTQIEFRQDTFENLKNIVLAIGEPAYITDTKQHVVGDGETTVEELAKNTDIDETYEIRTSAEKVKLVENIVDQSIVLERVQGRTLVRNQAIDIRNAQVKTLNGMTSSVSVDTGIITISGTSTYEGQTWFNIQNQVNLIKGHIYYLCGCPAGGSTTTYGLYLSCGAMNNYIGDFGAGNLFTAVYDAVYDCSFFTAGAITVNYKIKPQLIDLTLAYGIGNEPTTVWEMWNDSGYIPYDEGSFIHSNNKLISTGKNLWNEKWEIGAYDNTNGTISGASGRIRGKDFINVFPNTKYYIRIGIADALVILQYDINKKYLGSNNLFSLNTNREFTTNSNAYFIKFYWADSVYKDIYNNDICINLYDESFNGTYEPYKEEVVEVGELKEWDYKDNQSGNDVLGTGEIDLGTVDGWEYYGDYDGFYTYALSPFFSENMTVPTGYNDVPYAFTSKYSAVGDSTFNTSYTTTDLVFTINIVGMIKIRNKSCNGDPVLLKQSLQGVKLLYKKATPVVVESNNFPTGYSAYNNGLLIQEGTISYIITERIGTTPYARIKNNLLIETGQQRQINSFKHYSENIQELDAKINNTYWLSGGTSLSEGTNLNNIITIGNYYCSSDDTSSKITNKPTGVGTAFILKVEAPLGTVGNYVSQTLRTYNDGKLWFRKSNNSGSSWNGWTQYAQLSDIPSIPSLSLVDTSDTTTNPIISGLAINGHQITVTRKSLDDLGLAAAYKYKGSVAVVENLPASNNVIGDVYNVESNGVNYAWDGSQWDSLGGTVDLSGYLPLSGGYMTGPIGFRGSKNNWPVIQFIDNAEDEYGIGVKIGAGGTVLIGGGESTSTIHNALIANGGTESLILSNDFEIDFYTNCQNGYSSAIHTSITETGEFTGKLNWSNLLNKPIELYSWTTTSGNVLSSEGWAKLQGRTSGPVISVSQSGPSVPAWISAPYSSNVVFGGSDCKGFLSIDYATQTFSLGGGNIDGSTDDNPRWYMKFKGTHSATYDLDSFANSSSVDNISSNIKSIHDWLEWSGLNQTITVGGNADTYYPVMIELPTEKSAPTFISIHKNLGTTTPSIPGNHENGTSSLWLMYEGRYTGWDGNGGYIKTLYKSEPYGTLCAHAEWDVYGWGGIIVWLRGGNCVYEITTSSTSTVEIKYEETNISSSTYPHNIGPRTELGNRGEMEYLNGTIYYSGGRTTGNWLPNVSNYYSLGTNDYSWKDIWAKGTIVAYKYASNNTLPAITMDKPGSYSVGIGADGTENRIKFGPSDLGGTTWYDANTFNFNEWYFQGYLTTTNTLKSPTAEFEVLYSMYNRNLATDRPTNLNVTHRYAGSGIITHRRDLSTPIATGYPGEGYVDTYMWDTPGAWDTQFYIPNSVEYGEGRPKIRFRENGEWADNWKSLAFLGDSANRIHYGTTDQKTSGYYKVNIKSATNHWMAAFTIRVYQNYYFYDINISGYSYYLNAGESNAQYWYEPRASLADSSADSIDVSFGANTLSAPHDLWVAIPAGNYTGIDIINVANGYYQFPESDLNDVFSIEYVENLTNIQTTITTFRPIKLNEKISISNHINGTYGYVPFFNGINSITNSCMKFSKGDNRLVIGDESHEVAVGAGGIGIRDMRMNTPTRDMLGDYTFGMYFHELRGQEPLPGLSSYPWMSVLHAKGWSGDYQAWELAGPASTGDIDYGLYYRSSKGSSNTEWNSWHKVAFEDWVAGFYYNKAEVDQKIADAITGGTVDLSGYLTIIDAEATYAKKGDVPTKISQLTNDSGFITGGSLTGYATELWVTNQNFSKFSGSYNDLTNKPDIPTQVSDLANDEGFVTSDWISEQGFATLEEMSVDFVTQKQLEESGFITGEHIRTSIDGNTGLGVSYVIANSQLNATAIGASSNAQTSSVAVGSNSTASGDSVAIGYLSSAFSYTIAIGESATSSDTGGVAIGYSSHSGTESISLGNNSKASYGGIAIGHNSKAEDVYNTSQTISGIAIGHSANAKGDNAIAIGRNVEASSYSNKGYIKIGTANNNYTYYSGSGTTWSTTSDIRDKINIKPITNALKVINAIEPISFNYNMRSAYSSTGNTRDYDIEEHAKGSKAEKKITCGFKAQGIAEIMDYYFDDEEYAGVVEHYSEGGYDAYYTSNGELIPFLVGAIQEQQKIIEDQQSQIDTILTKLEELLSK